MMTKDYASEARLRDLLEADGTVRDTAFADFYEDLHDGRIDDRSEAGLAAHIAKMKDKKSHRFVMPSDTETDELGRRAYLDGNLTAQGLFERRYGTDASRAMAAKYNNTVGSGKPGTAPEADTTKNLPKDHKNNPWADAPANIDARTGRYSAAAISRQASLCKTDIALAARIAASVGARVGDVRPRRRAA